MDLLNADSLVYPEFVPDVDNYFRPNCMYLNVENVTDYVNGISLSILMLNIRSCCKNLANLFQLFVIFFLILRV